MALLYMGVATHVIICIQYHFDVGLWNFHYH